MYSIFCNSVHILISLLFYSYNKNSGNVKPKRNGIVTNPALRIMPAIRSGLEMAAGRKNKTPHMPTDSFKWRKETPL